MIPVLMLFPAIVAVAFRILAKEGFRNVGWGLGKWWYVFPAVLVPLGVAFAVVLVLRSMNGAALSDTIFVFQDGMLTHSRIGRMLGNQPQSIPFLVFDNNAAGLLPPHDHIVLTHSVLYSRQACPDQFVKQKMRRFL
jgi:hypothetical protein